MDEKGSYRIEELLAEHLLGGILVTLSVVFFTCALINAASARHYDKDISRVIHNVLNNGSFINTLIIIAASYPVGVITDTCSRAIFDYVFYKQSNTSSNKNNTNAGEQLSIGEQRFQIMNISSPLSREVERQLSLLSTSRILSVSIFITYTSTAIETVSSKQSFTHYIFISLPLFVIALISATHRNSRKEGSNSTPKGSKIKRGLRILLNAVRSPIPFKTAVIINASFSFIYIWYVTSLSQYPQITSAVATSIISIILTICIKVIEIRYDRYFRSVKRAFKIIKNESH